MAEDIHEILTKLPELYSGSAKQAVLKQLEISAVATLQNLREAHDVYGGAGESALKEAIRVLKHETSSNRRRNGKRRLCKHR